MRLLRGGLSLVLVSLWLAAAAAAEAPLGYTLKWRTFPDAAAWNSPSLPAEYAALLPAWQPEVLARADYAELTDWRGRAQLSVTCETTQLCYLSLAYFSPAGQCRIATRALALPHGSQVTLTMPAGAEPAALTLLCAWEQPASDNALLPLLLDGRPSQQALPELQAVRWFKRSPAQRLSPPWSDYYRREREPPSGFTRGSWPLCLAEVLPDQTLRLKDCALAFKGYTSFALDDDGPYGYWQLDWSSPLGLALELPGPALPVDAVLVVYAMADSPVYWGSGPALEVSVNNQRFEATAAAGQLLEMQPISFKVSPSLVRGINKLEVRPAAFAPADWRVSRVELWSN